MPKSALPSTVESPQTDARTRILTLANKSLFAYGYSALTMDELASDLGISKKTLYVYFRSKDALVEEIFNQFAAGVRAQADALFADQELSFTVKMHRFGETMIQRLSQLSPHLLRDLQRFAPHIYRRLEELRNQNIPYVFGGILRQGQAAGIVRKNIDPTFAVEFWRPALQSLLHPDTLERLKLDPHEVMTQAIDLFFGGLLTPAGRKDYEKKHTT